MRTEDELRDALTAEPTEPERVERMAEGILARTAVPPPRRRPLVMGFAVALTLAVLVGLAVTSFPRVATPADPPTPTQSLTPTPPNDRVEGNWRLTHRIDPPPGWTIDGHSVAGTREGTSLRGPDPDTGCGISVLGVGEKGVPLSDERQPTQVNGRPAYSDILVAGSHRQPLLTWEYRDDQWASVNCSPGSDLATVRDIAERVVFEPVVMRLPIRLTWVPDDFWVVSASEQDFAGGVRSDVSMWSTDVVDGFAISVATSPKTQYDLKPGQTGTTTQTVAGYPAVLQAEWHKIQLDAGTYTIELTADGYKNGQTEWAPGRKDLLIRLAGTLEVAPDLGDRATWFDAEQAVPN